METNYWVLLPEMILSVAGVLLMVLAPLVPVSRTAPLRWLGLLALAGGVVSVATDWGESTQGFFGMVFQDNFALFAKLLFLLASAAVLLISESYLREHQLPAGEFFALLLFATVGMCLMAASADLIMTFLGIEVLSISTYVLAAFRVGDKPAESAWKYFILGAFSTGFLLYGIAFVYGSTGSTKYSAVVAAISGNNAGALLFLGLGLILVGFGFKAALAPFHVWTPDVYEGAPVPITAHLAVTSKAAAFVALARLLLQVFPGLSAQWQWVLWVLAVATMVIGNVAALTQTNVKRILAYSSIAHAGYLLVGLTSANDVGVRAVLFYLASYGLMTLGAFAVVQVLSQKEEKYLSLTDYSGLASRYPFLCLSLAVFLISMAGIPTTAGFLGKLYLFSAAIKSELYWLVVLALLASAVAVYYYLRIIVYMYMRPATSELPAVIVPAAVGLVIVVMVVGTFWLGLFPEKVLHLVSEARFY